MILPLGPESAARQAEIWAELRSAARPIPSNDLWIAAQAREHGYPVVSRDRHFETTRGLRLVRW